MWLKDGDQNTKFFHGKAAQRRRRNYFKMLRDALGKWCTQQDQVVDTIVNFYQDLFTTSNPSDFEEVADTIPQLVTHEMNDMLLAESKVEEVESALRQMAPLKALRPDGMPPLFYQSYWSLLGSDVTQSILLFLNSGSMPKALGHSLITLIPKVKNPEFISELRPISLSNVPYRVFVKVLANQLKLIMPRLISKQQSAFMSDLLISNNILVAFESLHYMRNHGTGKFGYMVLKLDMSKAYDCVEWKYMEKILEKVDFLRKVETFDDGMHHQCILFDANKW